MEFRSRFDNAFIIFLAAITVLILAVCFLPMALDREAREALPVIAPLCVLTLGFLAWNTLSIKYVLTMDYLYVQGGPFRSRIPYGGITRVAPTRNVWYGYRLTTAFDAIEIFYRKGLLGSVKITPRDPERFIAELKKRCPNAVFEPLR